MSPAALVVLGFACSLTGSLGGLGGATLLVPALVLGGLEPREAAPLGLVTVAAGSLAAAARQIDEGFVHHRLGVTVELASTTGAFAGAFAATTLAAGTLTGVLAVVAFAAAAVTLAAPGSVREPHPEFAGETSGEWPGSLAGVWSDAGVAVPYQARRTGRGLVATAVAGLVAGLSGTGGGFVKTPALAHVMGVPVKVAAATTTFTLGITASSALLVHLAHEPVELRDVAAVAAGALAGGRLGAQLQARLAPLLAARATAVVLAGAGVALVAA